jgi:hypothetical protein
MLILSNRRYSFVFFINFDSNPAKFKIFICFLYDFYEVEARIFIISYTNFWAVKAGLSVIRLTDAVLMQGLGKSEIINCGENNNFCLIYGYA